MLYGRSLGSGPSCYLAAQTAQSEDPQIQGPVGGVILHAPFLSVYRIVLDTGCTIYGDKFPNVDYVPMIKSPLILCHGTADQIVPFNHSERMFEALPEDCRAKPLYIEGMGHNNVHSQVRPMFVSRLNEYLDQHVRPKISNPSSSRGARLTKSLLPFGGDMMETEEEQQDPISYAMSVFAGADPAATSASAARRRR